MVMGQEPDMMPVLLTIGRLLEILCSLIQAGCMVALVFELYPRRNQRRKED